MKIWIREHRFHLAAQELEYPQDSAQESIFLSASEGLTVALPGAASKPAREQRLEYRLTGATPDGLPVYSFHRCEEMR